MDSLTERELVEAVAWAQALEKRLLAAVNTADLPERDQVQTAFRRAKPLRQALETWVAVRALRAQLRPTSLSA